MILKLASNYVKRYARKVAKDRARKYARVFHGSIQEECMQEMQLVQSQATRHERKVSVNQARNKLEYKKLGNKVRKNSRQEAGKGVVEPRKGVKEEGKGVQEKQQTTIKEFSKGRKNLVKKT